MLNLKKIREENNLNQKELSIKLNRTIACISSWETGKTEPSIDDLIKLADILNVTTDYLVGRTDEYGFMRTQKQYSKSEIEILDILQKINKEERNQVINFLKTFIK